MCDPEEEKEKITTELDRRSFVVKTLLGLALGVAGFFAGAVQLLRQKTEVKAIKGGPYAMPKSAGGYTLVDVTQLWNDVGIATSAYKSLSNFDQEGKAFAREACPPSLAPELSVITCPNDGVRFVFPDQTERVMNVIKCQSQALDVPPGRYSKIHLLGASIRGSKGGITGSLRYEDEDSDFDLIFEPWRSPTGQPDIVVDAGKLYSADGSELSGPGVHAYLYHTQLSCDRSKVLHRLILPSGCHCRDHGSCACKVSDIRVLAVTLEP